MGCRHKDGFIESPPGHQETLHLANVGSISRQEVPMCMGSMRNKTVMKQGVMVTKVTDGVLQSKGP